MTLQRPLVKTSETHFPTVPTYPGSRELEIAQNAAVERREARHPRQASQACCVRISTPTPAGLANLVGAGVIFDKAPLGAPLPLWGNRKKEKSRRARVVKPGGWRLFSSWPDLFRPSRSGGTVLPRHKAGHDNEESDVRVSAV